MKIKFSRWTKKYQNSKTKVKHFIGFEIQPNGFFEGDIEITPITCKACNCKDVYDITLWLTWAKKIFGSRKDVNKNFLIRGKSFSDAKKEATSEFEKLILQTVQEQKLIINGKR